MMLGRSQTVVIIGATRGIGRECARSLSASGGWRVVITGTDTRRTERVARSIGADPATLDLGSLASVHAFVDNLRERQLPLLDVLVLNAGIQLNRWSTVDNGVERTFAVNYLGQLALVLALIDSPLRPKRVVVVTSGAHDPAVWSGMPPPRLRTAREMAFDRPRDEPEDVAARRSYSTSKLCSVMLTYELARRHRGEGILVNAFDPGLVPGTAAARDAGIVVQVLWKTAYRALILLPGVHTARNSGATLARLVTDPALANVTGAYFSGKRRRRSSEESYDDAAQRMLYEQSIALLHELNG